jgi:hypothetical protein
MIVEGQNKKMKENENRQVLGDAQPPFKLARENQQRSQEVDAVKRDGTTLHNQQQVMQQQQPRSIDLKALQSTNAERMRRHRASLTEEQKAENRAKDAARMAAKRKASREERQQPQKVDEALDAQGQQRARKGELQRERRRMEKANRDATKLHNEERKRKKRKRRNGTRQNCTMSDRRCSNSSHVVEASKRLSPPTPRG